MKGWNQWRTLAADTNITAAKVGNSGDAGTLGNDIGVAYLQGKATGGFRSMVNGLAVTAYGFDLCGRNSGLFQQG